MEWDEKRTKLKYWRYNHRPGAFVWVPPPAAADVCLEELRKARIKRQISTHVVVIPRLMTPVWLKQLYKTADLVFSVKPMHSFWSKNEFEPLTIAICFPYLSHFPWQLRGAPKMYAVARKLRQLSCKEELAGGHFLRKLLSQCRKLHTMQEDVVRRVLFFGQSPPVPNSDPISGKRSIGECMGASASRSEDLHASKRRRSHSGTI